MGSNGVQEFGAPPLTERERIRRDRQRRQAIQDRQQPQGKLLPVPAPASAPTVPAPAAPALPPGRVLIRLRQVLVKTGLAQSSLYDMIEHDEFPKPVPLSERRVAWLLHEIEAWIEQRIAVRDQHNNPVKLKVDSAEDADA